ncbi:MAG: divalent-cation tolerance protein CutA [Rickettsiales bacterium]|nr:divalent-cation tolerance protein CutA [Rickettsiales bacterium]
MKKFAIFYVTAPNQKLAVKIGKSCLKEKLVACVNIINKVTSLYKWQGKFCQDDECILIMKGLHKNFPKIKNHVQKLHQYSCPCILELPILDGNRDFLDWIIQNCKNPN